MNMDLRLGDYRETLRRAKADLIFTSPPYNIGSRGPRRDGVRKLGGYDPKSYAAVTGYPDSLPEEEYQDQQAKFFVWAASHLNYGGTLVYNHKPRRRDLRMIHPAEWFLRPEVRRRLVLMEEVIWDRGSTHNHSKTLMWPTTERLYVFRKVDEPYSLVNTISLPHRSDVWRLMPSRPNGHNVPFPLQLASAVIKSWSRHGQTVCDPYAGSGTTAIAAVNLGRNFIGSEQLEKYHTLALQRIARETEQMQEDVA